MRKVLALILAGGAGERLSVLSAERAKPAIPFAGKYRIIDFVLSNCVNSGIYKVAVITQYNPRSLAEHIGIGKPWDLVRMDGGVSLLQPYLGRENRGWYRGTADAVFHNLYLVGRQPADVEQVLILAGDHVYIMQYDQMIAFHQDNKADITIGVVEVPWEEASRMGNILLNEEGRVTSFVEKPDPAQSNLVSMGIYVFNKDFLIDCLEQHCRGEEGLDFGRDIIPALLGTARVFGYTLRNYWRDVGTIEAYFKAHMDLITDLPPFNLYDPQMRIYTVDQRMPPVKLGPEASVQRSLISNGCIINGKVVNSVLSPGVYVEKGARVSNSIIFNDTYIEADCVIDHCIIDKHVGVEHDCCLGCEQDYTPNQEEPEHLKSGITVVGKGAHLPPGTIAGRNVKIECWVEPADFPDLFAPFCASGTTVKRKTPQRFRI
ncbi:MAG: glucose-1-phosphate adenylyltransferase family protein [Chloroflexota bacterium]